MTQQGKVSSSSIHSTEHRPEIDGLRAVALVLVVLFHAEVPGFESGFIGVDVFFVLSGFLITHLLVREVDGSGRIDLGAFWSRRFQRLAPALTVMIVAVLIAAAVLFSPLRWGAVSVEAIASSAYVSNVLFAARSTGYFDQAADPSPLLHTWSLSLEEQFYVVWPVIVAAVVWVSRRVGWALTSSLRVFVPVACVSSFAVSLVLTDRGSPWAYLALPSRWWEIGAGAAAAIFMGFRARPVRLGVWSAAAGMGLLIASTVLITSTTPFPGAAALGPVGATVLFLAAGTSGPVQRALATPPMTWLGRRSYSWYLWHWPVLVFAGAAGVAESLGQRVMWAGLSLAPAVASYRLVERPVRASRRFAAQSRRGLLLGAGCTAVVLVGASSLLAAERSALRDPFLQALRTTASARVADFDTGCEPVPNDTGAQCSGVEPTVLLVGDSYGAQWVPAFETAVRELGGHLIVRTRGGCPPWRVSVAIAGTERVSAACEAFAADTDQLVDQLDPDLVVVTSAAYAGRVLADDGGGLVSPDREDARWASAVKEYLAWLADRSAGVGVVLGNPEVPFDPIECLAVHRGEPDLCEFELRPDDAVATHRTVVADEAREAGAMVMDPTPWVCGEGGCATWSDGVPVFADRGHLSAAFVERQIPQVREWLSDALRADPG